MKIPDKNNTFPLKNVIKKITENIQHLTGNSIDSL